MYRLINFQGVSSVGAMIGAKPEEKRKHQRGPVKFKQCLKKKIADTDKSRINEGA